MWGGCVLNLELIEEPYLMYFKYEAITLLLRFLKFSISKIKRTSLIIVYTGPNLIFTFPRACTFLHHLVFLHILQILTQISLTLWNLPLIPQAEATRLLPSCSSHWTYCSPLNSLFNLLSQNEFLKHRSSMSCLFMLLLFSPVLDHNWEKQ